VNPNHPLLVSLYGIRNSQPVLAPVIAAQVLDNALLAAGLVEDARYMLPRLNEILITAMQTAVEKTSSEPSSHVVPPPSSD